MNNIFVTGASRSGKSTLVQQITEEMDLKIEGIRTPELRRNKRRVGFKLVNVATGEKGILAHIEQDEGPRLSKYRVNMDDLEKFTEKCLKNISSETDLVVIDEIGTMELFSDNFTDAVIDILESNLPVLAVLHRNYVSNFNKYGTVYQLDNDSEKVKIDIENRLTEMLSQNKR
ncbi:MAG: nucleoside-triphosphatase [Thermoplasmatota archaeon]